MKIIAKLTAVPRCICTPTKCHGDSTEKALTTKLFQKATAAKELLTIDETDPDAVSGRQTIILRYLWYEHERAATESPEDDQALKNFQMFLKRAGPSTGRVLPGIGLLHATLLQCFRSRRKGGTNVPAAENS